MSTTTRKYPKLIPGHTYRFTFTPPAGSMIGSSDVARTPYSCDVTVRETGDHSPRALIAWANRWTRHDGHVGTAVDVTPWVES